MGDSPAIITEIADRPVMNFTENDSPKIREHFPFPSIRVAQEEALQAIEKAHREHKKYVVLEIPTGGGKSGIGVAAGSWAKTVRVAGNFEPGAYYCSPQKSLTAQLMGDFEKNGLAELKGRANYNCGYHFPEEEGGELMSCEETDFFYPEHAEKGGCHGYKLAKEAFCATPLGTTNFAYYLSESNFVGQLKDRTMLILDEAHNAEQQILGLANIEITKWRCEEVGIDFMSLPFIKADAAGRGVALDYLNETFRPAAAAAIQELTSKAEELRDKKLMKDAAKMKKKAGGLERFLQSLDLFLKSENFNDWMVWSESEAKACPECRTKFKFAGKKCYRCGAPVPLQPAKMVIKPLTATLFADKLLFSKADMVILMSATILDFDTFMRNLGIKKEDAVTLAMDSDFPLENRPIYYKPVANMSSKTIEAAKPLIAAECAKILRKHANDKGIIHTHTFAITKYIVDYLTRQGFGDRILTHDENSPKGTRELIIEEHKRRVNEPTVIISPSMTEGLDLKDDLGRFGIVCKVPYEFMTDYVKARMARDGDWYNWTTALKLQQATGRTVRHNKDKAEHYIIDAQFGVFIQRAGKMFSPWWSKSILFPGDYKEDW
jgi:Rad3-related DNA helicase